MRKFAFLSTILFLALSLLVPTVLATEQYEMLPVDVIQYPERLEVYKIYEMATSVDPAKIPREDFERSSIQYTCTDILREVVIGNDVLAHTETETIESTKNDIESVLSLLQPSKDVLTEDGFHGTLHLDASSIKSEISGYGSRTSIATITRNYPNLSDADSSGIQQIHAPITSAHRVLSRKCRYTKMM